MAGPARGNHHSELEKRKNESTAALKKASAQAAKIQAMLDASRKRAAEDKAAEAAAKKRRLADQSKEEDDDQSDDFHIALAAAQPGPEDVNGDASTQIDNDPEPPSSDESFFQPSTEKELPTGMRPPAALLQHLQTAVGACTESEALIAFEAALEHHMTDLLPNTSTLLAYCFRSASSTGCPHAAAWLSRYYDHLPQGTAPAWSPSLGDFLHSLQAVGYVTPSSTTTSSCASNNPSKPKATNSTQQTETQSPGTAPESNNTQQQDAARSDPTPRPGTSPAYDQATRRGRVYAQALDRMSVILPLLTSLSRSHARNGRILDFNRSAQSECVQVLEALLRLHMVPSITQRHLSSLVTATRCYAAAWSSTQEATWSAAVHKVSTDMLSICPSYMAVLHVCCLMDVEGQAMYQLQQSCLVALLAALVQPTKGQAKDVAGPKRSRGSSGSDLAAAQQAWNMLPGASTNEPSKLLKGLLVHDDNDNGNAQDQDTPATAGRGKAAAHAKKAAVQRTDFNKVFAVLQCIFHIVWPVACKDGDSTAVLNLAKKLQQYVCSMSTNVKSSRNLSAARVATTCAGFDNLLGFSIPGLEPINVAGQNSRNHLDDDDDDDDSLF